MENKTISLEEAAKMLGFKNIGRLRTKCSKGLVPGAFKLGRSWMFYLPPLLEYMENEYKLRREAAQVGIGAKLWQSSRKKVENIYTQSSRSSELELMNRRKQIRDEKLKSMRISVEMR